MDVALSERERQVLVAMIEQAFDRPSSKWVTLDSRQRWLDQVPRTRVVGRCSCGTCPSVDLAVSDNQGARVASPRVVLEAAAPHATLLLFIDDDCLSYLELAPSDPDLQVQEFPPPETIDFPPPEPC